MITLAYVNILHNASLSFCEIYLISTVEFGENSNAKIIPKTNYYYFSQNSQFVLKKQNKSSFKNDFNVLQ